MQKLILTALSLFTISTIFCQNTFKLNIFDYYRNPIPNAEIRINDSQIILADSLGQLFIENARDSLYLLVQAENFVPREYFVISEGPDTIYLEKILQYTAEIVNVIGSQQPVQLAFESIPESELEVNLYPNISPLLNNTPGVWMQSGALNTNRISIRGVGNREPFATSKLKAYLDEIPLSSGIGESSIEDIDPAIFSSIDIWRSSASSIWGAGLGGMIHLKSRNDRAAYLSSGIQLGSFGLLRNNTVASLPWKNNMHHTILQFQYTKSDGYRQNSEYDKKSYTLMQKLLVTPNLDIKIFSHLVDLKSFIPSSLGITAFMTNPSQAASNWLDAKGNEDYIKGIHAVSSVWKISDRLISKGSIFLNHFDSKEIRPFNDLAEGWNNKGIRNRLTYSFDRSILSLGFEYFNEKYRAEIDDDGSISKSEENRNYLNIFSQLQGDLSGHLNYFLALSLHKSSFDIIEGNQNLEKNYQPHFSPSIGLSYSPDSKLTFSASLSHGFSPVSVQNALNSNGEVNQELLPESGWTSEVGIRWVSENRGVSAEMTLYRLAIHNLIVAKRLAEDQFENINAGETRHDGIEIAYTFLIAPKLSWQGNATVSNHKFIDFIDGENDYSGNELTGTAPLMFNNDLIFNLSKNFQTRIEQRYISKVPIRDDNTLYGDRYTILNFILNSNFKVANQLNANVTFALNNLFDTEYASMYLINASAFGGAEPRYYYPGLPRNFNLRIQLRYDL